VVRPTKPSARRSTLTGQPLRPRQHPLSRGRRSRGRLRAAQRHAIRMLRPGASGDSAQGRRSALARLSRCRPAHRARPREQAGRQRVQAVRPARSSKSLRRWHSTWWHGSEQKPTPCRRPARCWTCPPAGGGGGGFSVRGPTSAAGGARPHDPRSVPGRDLAVTGWNGDWSALGPTRAAQGRRACHGTATNRAMRRFRVGLRRLLSLSGSRLGLEVPSRRGRGRTIVGFFSAREHEVAFRAGGAERLRPPHRTRARGTAMAASHSRA